MNRKKIMIIALFLHHSLRIISSDSEPKTLPIDQDQSTIQAKSELEKRPDGEYQQPKNHQDPLTIKEWLTTHSSKKAQPVNKND